MSPFTFTSTKTIAEGAGVKVLCYGNSGIGKTRLCATAPAPLILSAEGGMLSLREYDIPVVVIDSVETLLSVNEWCYTSPDANNFQTICLDTISEIAEVILTNAKLSLNDGRQAYGELAEKMMQIIKSFRDLPYHNVYFSCKLGRDNDPHTGAMLYGPSLPGKILTQGIAYHFDEVFKLDAATDTKGNEYNYLLTKGDQQNIAKDRSGSLLPQEYPDLSNIFNKIKSATQPNPTETN